MSIPIGPVADASKYHCNYCCADCSRLRVSCAQCPDFDACLQCFASGAEMGEHKRDHPYRLMDNGTFKLIVADWTADEEMLLLDGIEQHGLGNWDDIADHVGTKSAQETQRHFENIYLSKNIGKITLPSKSSSIPDHTLYQGQMSPTLTRKLEPLDMTSQEQQELGYMPNRDDFEREYENDAESLMKSLVCSREDDELETAMKLSLADMYWRVLKERMRWKRIARQFGLITTKHKLIASRRKLSREDREFKDKIRPFAQFTTNQRWEELISNRIREKELKERIKELIRYRRNGINKLTACREYEELKIQREKKKEAKKRMQVISPPRTTKTSNIKKEESEEERSSVLSNVTNVQTEVSEFKEKLKQDACYPYMSDKEKQLCAAMLLPCSKYMTLKTFILNEYAAKRMNIPFKTKCPTHLSLTTKNSLQEFFMQCGWMAE